VTVALRDLEAVGRLLGRPPRCLNAVAARCPHGAPSVLEQRPYDDDGTPFPTTFWLTCRALVEAVARLESAGGVAELERELAGDPALAADRAAAEGRVQARRRALLTEGRVPVDGGASLALGLAGERPGGGLKCLHAHAAAALADPPYRLGERVLERSGAAFPERCCAW
jgi:hypothetical protein